LIWCDLSQFEVDAQMLPGTYEVKFLVDGEWRLSDVW
jgi:uncharacterized lipoprotein YmbA